MASVSLRKLDKSYGALRIVKGIDLEINDGEFVVFVGPSGCGKSTTLRMVAGLESISGGEVMIGDRVVNRLPPRERDIAMVFQDYALYPHKTVRENMGFSLKVRGVSASQANASIDEAAKMLGIEHLLDRRPGQLSGGQRQRVAMGRAIVRRPPGLFVRRAAFQPRRQAARTGAHGNQAPAPTARHDNHLCHP